MVSIAQKGLKITKYASIMTGWALGSMIGISLLLLPFALILMVVLYLLACIAGAAMFGVIR